MTGNYVNSRMIEGYVYAIVNQNAYLVNETPILPMINSGTKMSEIAPTNIYYTNFTDSYYSYTTFLAFNLQNTRSETHKHDHHDGRRRNHIRLTNQHIRNISNLQLSTIEGTRNYRRSNYRISSNRHSTTRNLPRENFNLPNSNLRTQNDFCSSRKRNRQRTKPVCHGRKQQLLPNRHHSLLLQLRKPTPQHSKTTSTCWT